MEKNDDSEFSRLAEYAGAAETNIEPKAGQNDKNPKTTQKTKKQTFRENKPLTEYVAPKATNESTILTTSAESSTINDNINDWIRRILFEIVNSSINKATNESKTALIADDTSADILQQCSLFEKVPFSETKKPQGGKSLLTKLLNNVRIWIYY